MVFIMPGIGYTGSTWHGHDRFYTAARNKPLKLARTKTVSAIFFTLDWLARNVVLGHAATAVGVLEVLAGR
jgi:hypothetical protein